MKQSSRTYDFDIELSAAQRERANRLHNELVYWNACDSSHRSYADAGYVEKIKSSNVTAINHTIAYSVDFQEAVTAITVWSNLYKKHSDVGFIGYEYADIARAKESGRTAIFMGFQDITAIEEDLSLLEVFHTLGIRWVQPTYQDRNIAGDGCGERYTSGLSNWGLKLVKELDRLKIIIDVSHVGEGTTIDCAEFSKFPIMATHSGARALVDTPRNKTDAEIKAIAKKGGVVGIAGKSGFLKKDGLDTGSTVFDMITHIEYIRDLVGIDHVCIGTDVGDERKYSVEEMRKFHTKHPEVAIIGPKLRTDIMHPAGVGPGTLYNITAGLVARDFTDEHIRLILGENVNRVCRAVWES